MFEEIQEGLEEICDDLDDSRLNELFEAISFVENDLGVYAIKVMISYICSNYQIESNIIRNRYLKVPDNHAAVNFASKNLPPSVYSGTFLFSGLLIILLITPKHDMLIVTAPSAYFYYSSLFLIL